MNQEALDGPTLISEINRTTGNGELGIWIGVWSMFQPMGRSFVCARGAAAQMHTTNGHAICRDNVALP